jgi:hypothetical protein
MELTFDKLKENLTKEIWFKDIKLNNNKIFVYVSHLSEDILKTDKIPDFVESKQVLVHFDISNKKADTYIEKLSTPGIKPEEVLEAHDEDIEELTSYLDEFKKDLSLNIVEDIFYEVHDDKNKLTNFGSKYPNVLEKMTYLYNKFGFNLIVDYLK